MVYIDRISYWTFGHDENLVMDSFHKLMGSDHTERMIDEALKALKKMENIDLNAEEQLISFATNFKELKKKIIELVIKNGPYRNYLFQKKHPKLG